MHINLIDPCSTREPPKKTQNPLQLRGLCSNQMRESICHVGRFGGSVRKVRRKARITLYLYHFIVDGHIHVRRKGSHHKDLYLQNKQSKRRRYRVHIKRNKHSM
jgi:hypothetical protein